ncbi:MAG TPA: pitrilysin family protein [Ignavibacteria bacterium]|nr:pitrilysin family protein [Ignavibacteria bacterium]HMR41848.1 pitrilysin family protein [Ignavibacteria bacterium]
MKRFKSSTDETSSQVNSSQKIELKEFRLPNGLQCYMFKDNFNPIINLSIGYKVGSKDETPSKRGLAHFFEHMMFQGSENVKKNEHFEYVMKSGGVCNAFTMYDGTVYYDVMPSNNLETALWLESDRMNSLNISEENMANQKSVVIEEKKQVTENVPYGTTNKNIFKLVFKDSGYEIPIIGEEDDINSFTVEEAKEFHGKYYSPGNAVLIVSGDIEYDNAEKLITKYFSGISKENNFKREKNVISEMTEDISMEVFENVKLPVLNLCYQIPGSGSKENYPLDYLVEIMASGKSSRLYKKLVYDQKLVKSIRIYPLTLQDAGVLIIKAMINPGSDIELVENEIYKELGLFASTGITDEEFEKVRNMIEFQFTIKHQKIDNIALESIINYLYHKDVNRINHEVENYLAVTKQDVQKSVENFILNKKRLKLTYLPEEYKILKNQN